MASTARCQSDALHLDATPTTRPPDHRREVNDLSDSETKPCGSLATLRVIGLGRAPDFDGTIMDKWPVNANGGVTARILRIEPTCPE
jgi:hypothetical protein